MSAHVSAMLAETDIEFARLAREEVAAGIEWCEAWLIDYGRRPDWWRRDMLASKRRVMEQRARLRDRIIAGGKRW